MLRKGVVEHVGAIMLVVISGAAIAGTLSSIQDHTLEPSQQGIEDRLQSFDTEVDIETQEQFRGLVVWNMMAAQQCAYNPLIYNWDEEYELEEEDLNLELNDIEVSEIDDTVSDIEDREFTYFGHGDVLHKAIEETEFSGQCMGANPISMPIPDALDTALGAAEAAKFWEWSADPTVLVEWEGQSAQGRFGKVGFVSQENIRIEAPELMAFNLGEIAKSQGNEERAPDFVKAGRASLFTPEGVLRDSSMEEEWGSRVDTAGEGYTDDAKDAIAIPHIESNSATGVREYAADGAGWREAMNAFRVRMVNVPTVTTGSFSSEEVQEMDRWRDQYRYVVRNTEYVVCEGSNGYIQSNAGRDIEEDGKEYSDEAPIFRDVVYPRVELTNRDNSCVEDAEILSENWIGDRVQPLESEEDFPSEDSPTKYYPYVDERGMWDEENGYQKFTSDLRIGEDTVVSIKSVLKPETADSLDLENWWDYGNEQGETIYRSGWAIDPDECPESSEYVITNMFYSENHETIYDESNDNVVLDEEGQTVNYSVDRFPEDSSFEINLDTRQFEHDEDGESPNVVTVRFKSYDGDSTNVGFAETGEVNIGGDTSDDEVEGSFPEHFIVSYEGEYDSLNIRWKSDPNNDYYDRDFRIDGNTGKTIEHGVDEIVVDFFGQNDDSPFGVDSFDVRGAKPAWC